MILFYLITGFMFTLWALGSYKNEYPNDFPFRYRDYAVIVAFVLLWPLIVFAILATFLGIALGFEVELWL